MKKIIITLVFTFLSFSVFSAPVNINQANAKTIAKSLKGIGLKKAEAIILYRNKNGQFKSINDLLKIKGIGKRTLEKNKADIKLTTPSKKQKKSKSKK